MSESWADQVEDEEFARKMLGLRATDAPKKNSNVQTQDVRNIDKIHIPHRGTNNNRGKKHTTVKPANKRFNPSENGAIVCSKCGNEYTNPETNEPLNGFQEVSYARFKSLCPPCSEESNKLLITPECNWFPVKCDMCRETKEDLGMWMIRPAIFVHRCKGCSQKSS